MLLSIVQAVDDVKSEFVTMQWLLITEVGYKMAFHHGQYLLFAVPDVQRLTKRLVCGCENFVLALA